MEKAKSAGLFLKGVLFKVYTWGAAAIFLAPYASDWYDKYIRRHFPEGWSISLPSWIPGFVPILFPIALIFWAAVLTYHEERIRNKQSLPLSFHEKIREWENLSANYSKFADKVLNSTHAQQGTKALSDEQVNQSFHDRYNGLIRETLAILGDYFSGEAKEKFKNMANNELFSPETIGLDQHALLLTTLLRNFQKNFSQYRKP